MRIETEHNLGDVVWVGKARVDWKQIPKVIPEVKSFKIGTITVIAEANYDGSLNVETYYHPENEFDVEYLLVFKTEAEAQASADKLVESHPVNKHPK